MGGDAIDREPGGARMRTGLTAADLPDLIEGTDIGVLATRRPDDSIMLSPVWWEWRDGGVNIWVDAETDRKIQHIRRDPRVTFVIPTQAWPYQGFEVRGEAILERRRLLRRPAPHGRALRWPRGGRTHGLDATRRASSSGSSLASPAAGRTRTSVGAHLSACITDVHRPTMRG